MLVASAHLSSGTVLQASEGASQAIMKMFPIWEGVFVGSYIFQDGNKMKFPCAPLKLSLVHKPFSSI